MRGGVEVARGRETPGGVIWLVIGEGMDGAASAGISTVSSISGSISGSVSGATGSRFFRKE